MFLGYSQNVSKQLFCRIAELLSFHLVNKLYYFALLMMCNPFKNTVFLKANLKTLLIELWQYQLFKVALIKRVANGDAYNQIWLNPMIYRTIVTYLENKIKIMSTSTHVNNLGKFVSLSHPCKKTITSVIKYCLRIAIYRAVCLGFD